HMRALGQLFSWGAPPEAALIQHLCPTGDFMELEEKGMFEELQTLPVGAFLVSTTDHAMAYICTEEGRGYFFDPNLGVIAIHDQKGFERLAEHFKSYEKRSIRIEQFEPKHV